MASSKAPRANLRQKIQVLDWMNGPPVHTQMQALRHFKSLNTFAISQATLSNWSANAHKLREEFHNNPNLEEYKKVPVMKYPEVTHAVEKIIEQASLDNKPITDDLIKQAFLKCLKEFGYQDSAIKLSNGMMKSFKRRNSIRGQIKEKRRSLASETPTMADDDLDVNFEDIFTNPNPSMGFNTRLIHSTDPQQVDAINYDSIYLPLQGLAPPSQNLPSPAALKQIDAASPSVAANGTTTTDYNSVTFDRSPRLQSVSTVSPHLKPTLPFYPTYESPMQYHEYRRRPYVLENFSSSKVSYPNSEKVERILENITDGYVTIYNSGTSAIMGILSYLNPPSVYINNSGYQGTHNVIKLLSKLTGLQKKSLDEIDEIEPKSVVLIETPMNPEGYLLDIAHFAQIAHEKGAYLLVDSTLAPPPLQFPFKLGADYVVYSAVKYLAGVSDLGAGFVVTRNKLDKAGLHEERTALGTSIANFDSFLLLRSLRTYRMRILTQCSNTKRVVQYLQKNLAKYQPVISKIHHSSLQNNNDCFLSQLNGYYNPVFALEFVNRSLAESVLTRFNFLSNNPNLEGGETLVEPTFKNPNFGATGNLLRFSIGCEDYEDIIRDIDQAVVAVMKS